MSGSKISLGTALKYLAAFIAGCVRAGLDLLFKRSK